MGIYQVKRAGWMRNGEVEIVILCADNEPDALAMSGGPEVITVTDFAGEVERTEWYGAAVCEYLGVSTPASREPGIIAVQRRWDGS